MRKKDWNRRKWGIRHGFGKMKVVVHFVKNRGGKGSPHEVGRR